MDNILIDNEDNRRLRDDLNVPNRRFSLPLIDEESVASHQENDVWHRDHAWDDIALDIDHNIQFDIVRRYV